MAEDFMEFMEEDQEQPLTDLEVVKHNLSASYLITTQQMAEIAVAHMVVDAVTADTATRLGIQAAKFTKSIEAIRKGHPITKKKKALDDFCKVFTVKLKNIETGLKKKLSDYQYSQELQRRKEEVDAQKAHEELQKKMDTEAEEAQVEKVKLPAPIVPSAPAVVRTEEGSASQRKKWVGEIVDAQKVPIEFQMPSQALIDEAVKMGTRSISGVRIYEKQTTVFR